MSVRTFIIGTLAIIILYLVFKNSNIFALLISKASAIFGNSFQAVTSVGNFGQKTSGGGAQ